MARYEDILKEIQGARIVPLEERIPKPFTAPRVQTSNNDFLQKLGSFLSKNTTLGREQAISPAKRQTYTGSTLIGDAIEQGKVLNKIEKPQSVGDVAKIAGSTFVNVNKELGKGMLKTGEGWIDAGLTLGNKAARGINKLQGALLGENNWYTQATKQNISDVENFIKKDLTSQTLQSLGWDEASQILNKYSLVGDNDLVGQTIEAIGSQVPNILTASTGGTKVSQSAANAMNTFGFGSKAFGNSVEEALKDGATFDQAFNYGVLSTAVEIGSEWLTGGIPGIKGTAGGGLDKLAEKYIFKEGIEEASSTLAKAILKYGYRSLGEGFEEAVSAFLEPFIKNWTYTKGEKVDVNQMIQEAIIGMLSAGIIGMPTAIGDIAQTGGKSNTIQTVEDLVKQDQQKTTRPIEIDRELQQRLSGQQVQAYTTDTSNYTGSQLKTYQNAINSGLLNNNQNTHDFVDFVGKISKDKDITFNFTNNQALQDRNIDAQINGFIDENGITLNIDSNMALEKVIGHEITHTLENMANEYNELKNSFKTLLGEEYNTRLEQIKDLYKGVEGANYENELISDLAGEYLFTNEEFINNLSTEKPSLFKRIYQEIKYLWKMATGTEQEKQLAKTMRIYENAYRNAGKATNYTFDNLNQTSKYDNLTTEESNYYDYLDDLPFELTEQEKADYQRLQEKQQEEPKKEVNLPTRKQIEFKDISKDYGKYKDLQGYDSKLTKEAKSFVPDRQGKRTKKQWLDVATYIGQNFKGTDEQLKQYAIQSWVDERPNNKENLNRQGKGYVKFTIEDWLNKIYESANRTKPITKYSLSQDNQGRELSKEQQEYFKDSKVRDENGNLMEVYHGTPNAGFTIFDINMSGQNTSSGEYGLYFTDSKQFADDFSYERLETDSMFFDKRGKKGEVYPIYLNIENMLDFANLSEQEINDLYDYASDLGKLDGKEKFVENMLKWQKIGNHQLMKGNLDLKAIANNSNYDGIKAKLNVQGSENEYIAFNSNQIKNVDNLNPTENEDIRYQISKQDENLPKGQFKGKSVARDTNIPTTQESALNVPANNPRSELKTKQTMPLVKNNRILKEESQRIANEINEKGEFTIKTKGWLKTATESKALKGKVYIQDLDASKVNYVVQSNQESLNKANKHLNTYGYEKSLDYVNNLMQNDSLPKASDVALMQRMIQEAAKRGDSQTVQDLIMDTAILGTDLGQATQALSIIKRLTPEGQLAMYTKLVERAKSRGEKSFDNVEITPKMVENLLDAYNEDGTYDQDDLNARVEQFKQDLADQMKATIGDKVDAWRYLSMLGNPKTHIRNIVSNVAMTGTIKVKNAMARTLETLLPVKGRTKTWKKASNEVKNFAEQTATSMKEVITGEAKYNEKSAIESKKQIFKNKVLEKLSDFNGKALEAEDWFFSKRAFQSTLQEYLTANGINTYEDIENNPELVEKAKIYAVEQAEIATFRQYSKLASTINQIEKKNKAARVAVQALIPFKKTPINVAKAGVNYSPLGLIKNISYDVYQLKQGNINASQFIDNLSQGLTGTTLTLLGYALAKAGILTGSGGDDKDDKYDKQLGKTGYSLNIGGNSYSISWLSPVAMPLLVGSNAYEQLEEQKEWDMNVVSDTLAKTLDPLNEMSFLQGLTNALQSYGSGTDKIKGALESTAQNYVGQFFPTIFSQLAATTDTKKRSTKASNDSTYKFGEQTVRSIMYKIPGLRQQLEVATDMWGNEKEQSNNIIERAFESFIAPYSKTKDITTDLDKEIKRVYNETGESGVIPNIPYAYVKYNNETYKMSAKQYTEYKKTYGQNAYNYLNNLINSSSYKNASNELKAKMIDNVYDYAKAQANEQFFKSQDIEYSNDTLKELNSLKEIGINSKSLPNYVADKTQVSSIRNNNSYSSTEKKQKIADVLTNSTLNDKQLAYLYDKYYANTNVLNSLLSANVPIKEYIKLNSQEFESDYNNKGKAISGSREAKYINYVNSLNLSIPQKAILIKMEYKSFNKYDKQIINYVNSLNLSAFDKATTLKRFNVSNFDSYIISDIMKRNISVSEKEQILKDLGFNVRNGVVYK